MVAEEKSVSPELTTEKQPTAEGGIDVRQADSKQERGREGRSESEPRVREDEQAQGARKEMTEVSRSAPAQVQQTPAQKDKITKDVENILSSGLGPLFSSLPADRQQAFRLAGEETAQKIRIMMDSGKLKVKSVLDLIRSWLRMIPGVNKFFLDQEAKIKTDKLVDYYESVKKNQNAL